MQKYIIKGDCPSKSNQYKVIRLGNRCGLGKQKSLYDYEKSFLNQMLNYNYETIEGEFKFEIDVYYPNRRKDLDNSLKVVLDCLQKAQAIKNDNKCLEIIAKKHLDKEEPRIEFTIIPL
ncbi:MAG: RusA family crossover junction endodeoxyribonuclease [Flavobacteriales bacterium]|nr:RusA family crossover junction endodeoxyribonuclease [Flavobacteriales bacterium]